MVRNPLIQPFAQSSIWNTPIGSGATYVDAKIGAAKHLTADVDLFYALSENDNLSELFRIGSWHNRSDSIRSTGESFPLPTHLIIPDTNGFQTPNNSTAVLLPDGETLLQLNAAARPEAEGNLYGVRYPFSPYEDETLSGSGALGGHGGSGLSSIGGTIRIGELVGDAPIRHALKINLWAERYLAYANGSNGGLGYRWPAVKADSYAAPDTYGGQVPELVMGSLLAIPSDISPEQLGLVTEPALKVFQALQDYGAYVADDPSWDAHALALENGVLQEFEHEYGYKFNDRQGDFYDDMMTIISTLHVVDNNGPNNIGGGGTPRVPLADEIDSQAVSKLQALLNDPDIEDTFFADFNGDGFEDTLWRNLATGANQVWLQDSNGDFFGGGTILPLADPNWQIFDTPDVDDNGIAEILWQNQVTNDQQVWYLGELYPWLVSDTGKRYGWAKDMAPVEEIVFQPAPIQSAPTLTPDDEPPNPSSSNDEPLNPSSSSSEPSLSTFNSIVHFEFTPSTFPSIQEIGLFVVDDVTGRIGNFIPGEAGYVGAAMAQHTILFSSIPERADIISNDFVGNSVRSFTSGDYVSFFSISGGTVGSFLNNEVGEFKTLSTIQLLNQTIDGFSLVYEDLTINAQQVVFPSPVSVKYQGASQIEVIDLTNLTDSVEVSFTIQREAFLDSLVGFYEVEDLTGQIKDSSGNAISPGVTTEYIQAAMNNRVIDIALSVENESVATVTSTLKPGKIFVPFIVVNGKIEELLDVSVENDPAIYFPFLGANSDGIDHIRLFSDNVLAFEDTTGGGDQDFDDLVVHIRVN